MRVIEDYEVHKQSLACACRYRNCIKLVKVRSLGSNGSVIDEPAEEQVRRTEDGLGRFGHASWLKLERE
jgi:hypothetical protein